MILSWKAPIYYNEKLIGSYAAEHGSNETVGSNFDYLSLLVGKPYPARMDKTEVFFSCSKRKVLDYYCFWLLGDIPLVSTRLADFLVHSAGLDVELLTSKSIAADGEDIGEIYYIMNAVEKTSLIR